VKIIFLDIDGVLNCEKYVHDIGALWDNPDNQIDPKAVARLNRLTDLTGAAIVVTSTWRISFLYSAEGMDEVIRNCLKSHGITGTIIGATEVTQGDRSEEIWDWITNHKDIIDNFVIIDDDRLEIKKDNSDPYLDLYFVRTSWLDGLQDIHVDKAIKILEDPNT
jgi:hypothetical protein